MKNEFVQRIGNCYVTDKGVQVFIRRQGEAVTRLNKDGMTFYYKKGSELFIHKCTDEIHATCPYHSIDSYNSREGVYDREIYDFDRVYIEISDGTILENYAVRDNEEGLVVTKLLIPEKTRTLYFNRAEVIKIIEDNIDNIYGVDGSKKVYKNAIIPSEIEILEYYKRYIEEQRKLEEAMIASTPGIWVSELEEFGRMYYDKKVMDRVYKIAINSITLDDLDDEIGVINRKNMVIVQSDDKDISSVKSLDIHLVGTDKYKVDVYEYPVIFYNYDYIKQLETTNLVKTKEPIISKRLNPQISPIIIKKGKKMVKRMKKLNK